MVGALLGGLGLATGVAQGISGLVGMNKAKKALKNYRRQDLKNHFEDMKISTAGSDILQEEAARNSNNLVNTVSRGGARAITGNIGRISAANTDAASRAAYELDKQYQDRNRLIASENSRIQDMYEQRENMDLQGIGSQLQAGRETAWNGLSAMQSAVAFGANSGMFNKSSGGNPGGKFINGGFGTSLGATNTYNNSGTV